MSSETPVEDTCAQAAQSNLPLFELFKLEYPDERSAEETILSRGIASGRIVCRRCSSSNLARSNDGIRYVRCNDCNFVGSFTAGGFYNRIRGLHKYLFKEWLMEQGYNISADEFSTMVHCAANTAQSIKKKYACVVLSAMDEQAIQVASAEFLEVVARRSIETPARCHPRAEEATVDNSEEISTIMILEDDRNAAAILTPSAVQVLEHLTSSQEPLDVQQKQVFELLTLEPISFDKLIAKTGFEPGPLSAVLVMLEIEGLSHSPSTDFYALGPRKKTRSSVGSVKTTNSHGGAIRKIVSDLRSVHQFISRKCLQLYLAIHWCVMDRKRWGLGSITQAALTFGYLSAKQATEYVSPKFVKMMLAGLSTPVTA